MSIPVAKAPLLDGKKGLIVGIANDQSIAWGCARAFRAPGVAIWQRNWARRASVSTPSHGDRSPPVLHPAFLNSTNF